jgi:hypothetical protein
VDCYNAGATALHLHVRDPKTGHISKNFSEYKDLVGVCGKPCLRCHSDRRLDLEIQSVLDEKFRSKPSRVSKNDLRAALSSK